MKLYTFALAPNSKKVSIFLRIKKKSISTFELNVRDGEQFKEPFNTMNPFNCVPFLELDNGNIISESISICRYLEEEYFPMPNLFGTNPYERSLVDMWNRRLELDGLVPLGHAIRNKSSFFIGRVLAGTRNNIKQSPEIVKRGFEMINLLFERIDGHLKEKKYICGNRITIPDITAYTIFKSCEILNYEIPQKFLNVLKLKNNLYQNDCFND